MVELDLDFYKMLFEDLDPESLRKRFLRLLLRIQNVERGSVWIQQDNRYVCVESLGGPTDRDIIKGASVPVERPSIVGWVSSRNSPASRKIPQQFLQDSKRMWG